MRCSTDYPSGEDGENVLDEFNLFYTSHNHRMLIELESFK